MRISRWTVLALASALAVTVVTPGRAQEVEIKPKVKVKRDKYVLTAEEIAERPDLTNAYDAVRLLRPNFLKPTRARGTVSPTGSYRGDRPVIDLHSLGGEGPPPSPGAPSTGPDPYKPSGTGTGSGGSSPYGGSSGGASSTLMPVVYFDDVKQENAEEMKNIRADELVEIRYMGGTEASGRYGSGHEGGAILVKTKRLTRP